MKAILITRERFKKELKVNRESFNPVIAMMRHPHVGIVLDEEIDVSKPDDNKMLFYYKRQYFDENNDIVLIYEEE